MKTMPVRASIGFLLSLSIVIASLMSIGMVIT
jgi:hypothetical protein